MRNPKTVEEIKAYIKVNKLPISNEYIESLQHFEKYKFNNIISYDEAYEMAKDYEHKGCLMYSSCAECSKVHNKFCPFNALYNAIEALNQEKTIEKI